MVLPALLSTVTLLLAVVSTLGAPQTSPSAQQNDILASKALANLEAYIAADGYASKTCTLKNAAVRREWGSLSSRERKEYIAAVKCLGSRPPISNTTDAPGIKRRYDDFVATHLTQALTIHATGNFLGWHRYFVWAYEKALREECGYTGYQPYWNWGKSAMDPLNSPVFDGSDTSMSGNGALFHANQTGYGIPTNDDPLITIPIGSGGGCLTSGPFKDWVVNLGPGSFPILTYITANPLASGLGYNPRCIRRDISQWTSSTYSKDSDIVALINQSNDLWTFWANMQGGWPAFENNYMGVHTAGHFTIGGDPGGDFENSPSDPAFFLHHAMIDRTWWTWQNLNPVNRTYDIAGTITIEDTPPSRNATLDDTIDLGVNAPSVALRDVMSSVGGLFCYIYE